MVTESIYIVGCVQEKNKLKKRKKNDTNQSDVLSDQVNNTGARSTPVEKKAPVEPELD